MNILSRTITGITTIILGLYLSFIGFLGISENWPGLIWGIAFIIIGFYILFNKKEDDIEKIKNKDSFNKK